MNPSSSSFSSLPSFSRPNLGLQKAWVDSMREAIEDTREELTTTAVSIFTVPPILRATDPDSYNPQQVALGPFHQWRPEVHDMQRYKVAAAKKFQTQMNVRFDRIVEIMNKDDEQRIRACYHKFLDLDDDSLAWMMAIDMAFLLEFLQVYFMKEQGLCKNVVDTTASPLSHVVDFSGKKLSHMTILRDVVKVENQIPLFLIKTMLEKQFNDKKFAKEKLQIMLMGLYHELSPFHQHESPTVDIDDCEHLLDFLYHMNVPNEKELGILEEEFIDVKDGGGVVGEEDKSFANFMKKSKAKFVGLVKKVIFSKSVTLLIKLPWKFIISLPVLNHVKEPIEHMLANFEGKTNGNSEDRSDEKESNAPLIEEITIPSVTEMAKAGIFFSPVKGRISDIRFDSKTSTLYLPVVNLDVNTEVFLRNLVAYEACVAPGQLVMARYTELMNGIIDTEEDAKYLRERSIVLNRLKSDKEVADLWNGMSKCVKMTKVPKMDRVIEEVNRRYAKTWSVRFRSFMKTYVFGSWRFLTLLAALFLLFLSTVQTVCSIYSCARVFKQLPNPGQIQGGEG